MTTDHITDIMRKFTLTLQRVAKAMLQFTQQTGNAGTNKLILLFLMISGALGSLLLINITNNSSSFSYLKLGILLSLSCCFFFVLSMPNILTAIRTILLILLPIAGIGMPPKRFGFSIFDILAIFLLVTLLHSILWKKKTINLIPDKFIFLFFISAFPSVFLGISPLHSAIIYFKILLYYVFFITIHSYLSEKGALVNIVKYLAVSLIVLSFAIFVECLTGVNLSGSSKNLNAFNEQSNIIRCAGFFQDPQKAGQFLAVGITFLILSKCQCVIARGKINNIVNISVVVSCLAIPMTVSKLSIISGFLFSLLGLFFFNRNHQLIKRMFLIIPLILLFSLIASGTITSNFLESSLGVRIQKTDRSAEGRMNIWQDSWRLLKDHTIVGIGPGNYQEFLMRTNPSLRAVKASGGYVPKQPENGYLKILYETGILGFFGFSLFFIRSIMQIISLILTNSKKYTKGSSIAAGFANIVFALCFITLFTTSDARSTMLFIMMYGVMHASTQIET